jgi:hypothetical protein
MLARMADSFIKSGFLVCFEPSLTDLGSTKVPDLAVTQDDGTFYLELANMYPSHDATLSDRMGLWFSIGVMESVGGLLHSGRIHKTLSKPRQDFVIEGIRQAAADARTQNRMREFQDEGAVEFAVAPESSKSELEEWATERGLEINSVVGPPLESDECQRIRNKINGEQKQLPKDRVNVIAITHYTHLVFESQMAGTVSRIEEAVYGHPHVGLVAIYGGFGAQTSSEHVLHFGDNEVHLTPDWPSWHYCLLIRNRFSNPSFSASTLARLKEALVRL